MRPIAPCPVILAILPRVEDPWPDTIGIQLPFTAAAAGGVLAAAASALGSPEKQERAIKLGGLVGFTLGSVFYCLALLVQVASSL